MTINKEYEVIRRVKLHTSPLVEADIVSVGKFQKETKQCYIFDGFRARKRCVIRIKEIERLEEDNLIKSQRRANIFELTNAYERGRAEAITEFAERLKEKKWSAHTTFGVRDFVEVIVIDQTAKELKEGVNNA